MDFVTDKVNGDSRRNMTSRLWVNFTYLVEVNFKIIRTRSKDTIH
jgi:hypothetical protein